MPFPLLAINIFITDTLEHFLPFGTAEQDSVEDSRYSIDISPIDISIPLFGKVHVKEQIYVSLPK